MKGCVFSYLFFCPIPVQTSRRLRRPRGQQAHCTGGVCSRFALLHAAKLPTRDEAYPWWVLRMRLAASRNVYFSLRSSLCVGRVGGCMIGLVRQQRKHSHLALDINRLYTSVSGAARATYNSAHPSVLTCRLHSLSLSSYRARIMADFFPSSYDVYMTELHRL